MNPDRKDVVVSFRCSLDTFEFLTSAAELRGWTVSHLCHVLVQGIVKDALELRSFYFDE